MGSRQMKRLMEQEEKVVEVVEEESEEEPRVVVKNLFSLLAEEEIEEEEEEVEEVVPKPAKKKKKKKNRKKKQNNNLSSKPSKDEDELDEIVRGIEEGNDEDEEEVRKEAEMTLDKVLVLREKYLLPEGEIKELFGRSGLEVERSYRSQGRGRGGKRKKCRLLGEVSEGWRVPTGLPQLNCVEEIDGVRYFHVEHTKQSASVLEVFYEMREIGDPSLLQELLQENPFQLDTLLQMAEVHQLQGNVEREQEFIELAVYHFEWMMKTDFDFMHGNARLPFVHPANRKYLYSLYRYGASLAHRGLSKSALEIAKIVLSLDRSDPLGVLYTIDHYAARAGEVSFLQGLLQCKIGDNLHPHHRITLQDFIPGLHYSLGLALFRVNQHDQAKKVLVEAIKGYPMILVPLLRSCMVEPTNAPWESIIPPLCHAPTTPELGCWIQLWCQRNVELWKQSQVYQLLQEALLEVDWDLESSVGETIWLEHTVPMNVWRSILLTGNDDLIRTLPTYIPRRYQFETDFDKAS